MFRKLGSSRPPFKVAFLSCTTFRRSDFDGRVWKYAADACDRTGERSCWWDGGVRGM